MSLAETLQAYLTGQNQGQLVIKFIGEEHLCKISIEQGQAVYITLGKFGPDETLDAIVGKQPEWVNFIKGMPVRKKLDSPLNELLLNIAGASQAAQAPSSSPAPQAEVSDAEVVEASVTVAEQASAEKVAAAITDFIDLVGPLGTILADNAAKSLNYTEGTVMDGPAFSRFLSALAAEIPESERQTFLDKYSS